MNRLLLLTIVFLLCRCAALAQPYYFRHYQVENGLSNNTVYCSAQDKDGFMWFGTKDGLNRFDGSHFKQFYTSTDERTLTPDFVSCLFVDAHGGLWAGLQKGVYRFDAAAERLVPFLDSLPDVACIHIDKGGQLWFTSRLVLYRYNFTTKTLKRFAPDVYSTISALCETPDGIMWAATPDGFLKKWNAAMETFTAYNMFGHSPAASSTFIQTIYPAGNNAILVGTTSQGLKLFQIPIADYKDVLTYNEDKTTVYVRDVVQNGPAEYWLATESGLFIWNFEKNLFTTLKKKTLDPYSLSDNAIYTLCKDQEGGIWAGTYFGGVNYYPKQYALFKKFFPNFSKNAISGNVIREICSDGSGNLWIGTEDAGLNKLNVKTGIITRFLPTGASDAISYTNIHGLLVVGNQLWIGTFEHGMDVLDIKTGRVRKHYKAGPGVYDLKSNFIVCLLQTSSGGILIGSSDGLYQYHKQQDGFSRVPHLPEHGFISSILEDDQKTIWVSTHGAGVFALDPLTHQSRQYVNQPDDRNSLSNNKVNAISQDSRHNLWFATEGGGLCKLAADKTTFSRYTTKSGLPSNFVFKVLEDNKHQLWITTSKGLVQLNPDSGALTVYTQDAGLLNEQFNYNSGYKDVDGTLYFGSVKGMIAFRPDSFVKQNFTAPVFITGFQVHNKELTLGQDSGVLKKSIIYTNALTLPHDQSSFSIEFAGLSYTAPEMLTYRYKMEGLDRDWTVIPTNRKVYYTNIAPGSYLFKVKASGHGITTQQKTLRIEIRPPFWATAWAYFLYAVVVLVLTYYLVRSYHQHTQNVKEKEIYEAKLDFFTNVAHEIRTPLTLIKGPLENLLEQNNGLPEIKEDVSTMERATNRLLALMTQILDFRKTELKGFSLSFSKVNVTALVQEEYENFINLAKKRNLVYTIHLPAPVYAVADEEALHKILGNLFSNAVKYAATQAHVTLLPPDRGATHLVVEVVNDGPLIAPEMQEKIFEPFYRLKQTSKQNGTGVGLALARSLAELHQGRLYLKESKDAYNRFIFTLPLQPKQAQRALKGSHPMSLMKPK